MAPCDVASTIHLSLCGGGGGGRPGAAAATETEGRLLGVKRTGKIAKEVAKLIQAVTFLLIPVGTAGLHALMDDDLGRAYTRPHLCYNLTLFCH
jgi:hypothetical protein